MHTSDQGESRRANTPRKDLSRGASGVSPEGREGGLDLTPPGRGYVLYKYRNAESMKTRNWHGLYWARQNEEGDYEVRTVPVSSGEYSAPGGVWPKEGFERTYTRVVR